MSFNSFIKGVGIGVAAGAVLTIVTSSGKKRNMHSLRGRAGRAVKAIGEVVESITDNFA